MPNDTPVRPNRIERILGVMAATVIGIAIVDIIVLLIAGASKIDLGAGAWPIVRILPLTALPIGFLLLVGFIIATGLRRRRESLDARG